MVEENYVVQEQNKNCNTSVKTTASDIIMYLFGCQLLEYMASPDIYLQQTSPLLNTGSADSMPLQAPKMLWRIVIAGKVRGR